MGEKGMLTKGFLTGLPFILVGALGAYNHLVVDPVPAPEYGYALSQRVEAYIEPVGAVQRRLALKERLPSDEDVLQVAELWVDGVRSGKLEHLPPVHASDNAREGVKEQILAARAILAGNLVRHAVEQDVAGNPKAALSALVTCYEIQSVGARFDVGALTSSYAGQNGALRRIRELMARTGVRLTPEQQSRLTPLPSSWMRDTFAEQSRALLSHPRLTDQEAQKMSDQFHATLVTLEAGHYQNHLRAGRDLPGHAPKLMYANLRRADQLKREQEALFTTMREESSKMLAESDQNRTSNSRS